MTNCIRARPWQTLVGREAAIVLAWIHRYRDQATVAREAASLLMQAAMR